MRRTTNDQLQDLLVRKVKGVSDDAIKSDGQVSAEDVEVVERLARLAEISSTAQQPRPRRRWPLIAGFGVTLLIVSILLFARVRETEIELDLVVSETSFVVPTQQVLTDMIPLSAIGAADLRAVQLPARDVKTTAAASSQSADSTAIRVAVVSDNERKGSVTLATTTVPAGTVVRVKQMDAPHKYQLSLKGNGLALRVDVTGPVEIGMAQSPPEILTSGIPNSILLEPASNEVDVDLTLTEEGSGNELSPQLPITDLAFFRIDEITDLDRTLVRRFSTVQSGTLYFESLNGEQRSLRPGETLSFEQSRGEIRKLKLDDGQISLMFHGYVRGIRSGSGENHRSLMPTYLEWLRARHGVYLLWGTTFYVFGLIGGLLRWWRNP